MASLFLFALALEIPEFEGFLFVAVVGEGWYAELWSEAESWA